MTKIHVLKTDPPYGGPIQEPPLDAADVRAAVLNPGGEDMLVGAQHWAFEFLNPVFLAQSAIEQADRRIAWLSAELDRLLEKAGRTTRDRTVIIDEVEVTPAGFHRKLARALLLIALCGFIVGNTSGTIYIVRSGADLYANDWLGASIFMAISFIAGACLKTFLYQLADDKTKQRVTFTLYGVAGLSFALWCVMAALTFAPEIGRSNVFVLGTSSAARPIAIALLLSHFVTDVVAAFLIFAGAEQLLLSGHRRVVCENPAFVTIQDNIAVQEAAIRAEAAERARAEEYLHCREAALAKVDMRARLAYRLEASRFAQSQAAAAASSNVTFLNSRS
jgi:hypothetical protein